MSDALPTAGRLVVSVVTGTIVERDAISNVCHQQILALDRFARRQQMALDVKVYLHDTTVVEPRAVKVQTAAEVVCDGHFHRSDVVIYHYGIYYPLFDSIVATPRTARVVVNYYGITPPGLTGSGSHAILHQSYRRAALMANADRIIVNSHFIGSEAQAMGFAADRIRHLPLAAGFAIPDPIPEKVPSEILRIAYLGRIVPAKGIRELLAAVTQLADTTPFRLTLMGARKFSCPQLLGEVEIAGQAGPLAGKVQLLLDRPGAEVREHLTAADVFVMPSHHEGFCVPVVEAVACGTGLIHSNSAALPETAGGLGLSFPAGNTAALLECLRQYAAVWSEGRYATDVGPLPLGEWRAKAVAHLQTFTRERFEHDFLRHTLGGVQPSSADRSALGGDARVHTTQQLCGQPATGGEPVSIGRHLQAVIAAPRRARTRRPQFQEPRP